MLQIVVLRSRVGFIRPQAQRGAEQQQIANQSHAFKSQIPPLLVHSRHLYSPVASVTQPTKGYASFCHLPLTKLRLRKSPTRRLPAPIPRQRTSPAPRLAAATIATRPRNS